MKQIIVGIRKGGDYPIYVAGDVMLLEVEFPMYVPSYNTKIGEFVKHKLEYFDDLEKWANNYFENWEIKDVTNQLQLWDVESDEV